SRTAEHPFERGAALDERTIAKVRPAVAQEVEGDEGHSRGAGAGRAGGEGGAGSAGAAGRAGCVRIDHVDSALKLLKACRLARAVERDDLAVEHERFVARSRPRLERGGDLRELAGFLVAEPRPETHAPLRRDLRDRPDAVVLRLVDELRVVERRLG